MPDNMSGNKGEWSELYAFLKLLNQGRVYAANERVEKINDIYYPILKIVREENIGERIEYVVDECNVRIEVMNKCILEVPRKEFGDKAQYLLKQIQSNTNSFEVKEIAQFANGIKVTKIKAPSTDTTDISMQIEDINTGYKNTVGFSIKSEIGHAPTLLNAGETTNFIYRITGISDSQMNEINAIESKNKIIDRMKRLSDLGGKIEFFDVNHLGFKRNLRLIDSQMPTILGEMLLIYYQNDIRTCSDLVDILSKKDPLEFGEKVFYEYKLKKFLCACALGMKPAKTWDGVDEANGGYIIVKADGEILAYHIYNRNMFEQYLIDNTSLERASTSRHKYMQLYKNENEMFIKLNLQVRFK